ncbi:hypothetical protein FIBSPDRAFT_874856 [Athelia psychrophila]|uniref:Uncharacterized protein n=1 Tax=Athelia psychrophila TaxID=1759441 RepID=A0A165X1H2_9AGAM|nr:hypothetical protein FIBSPDRAFT_874856 [Fibularhizoctonia sp. CBS 109695]
MPGHQASISKFTVHLIRFARSKSPCSQHISHLATRLANRTTITSECSQASSASPSLSSYPAEFRGAADYGRKGSDQYRLFHRNYTIPHYYCDECGSLVTTTG